MFCKMHALDEVMYSHVKEPECSEIQLLMCFSHLESTMKLEMLREVAKQQMGTNEATDELFSKVLFNFVILYNWSNFAPCMNNNK